MIIKITFMIGAIFLSIMMLAVESRATDDFVPVRGSGVGETQDQAVKEAYYYIFSRALVHVAGNEAEGAVGKKFRKKFERDFDGFRRKYFSPDTDYSCKLSSSGKHRCQVRGTFKMAALNSEVRKAVKSTEKTLSNKLVFFLAATKPDDEQEEFLRDMLEGEFVRVGYRIVTGKKARRLIKKKKVDFGLAIRKIDFTPFEYNKYDQRMSGGVTILFRLTDLKGGESLAVVPTAVNFEVPGTSQAILRTELVDALSKQAATEIAQRVTESVLIFQQERKGAEDAEEREDLDEKLYLVRLISLTRSDRKDIRAVRSLLKEAFPDARPKTDAGESDSTQVTLSFSTAEEVDHDDIVDAFFEINEGREGFDAEYIGGNEFALYYYKKSKKEAPTPEAPVKIELEPAGDTPVEEEDTSP
jgi:hypothetical protein